MSAQSDRTVTDLAGILLFLPPALCHGAAGILQSAKASPALAGTAFGQITHELSREPSLGITTSPGFLTGAAGTALALADHGQLPALPGCNSWDALLLLS